MTFSSSSAWCAVSARPDSLMDKIYVHKARLRMGMKLAERIKRDWPDHDIDVVSHVPAPTGNPGAAG